MSSINMKKANELSRMYGSLAQWPEALCPESLRRSRELIEHRLKRRITIDASTFTQQWAEAMGEFTNGASRAPESPPDPVAPEPPPAEPASIWLKEPEDAPANWKPFSEVFGFAPPSGNDRKGPVFEPGEFDASLRDFIPSVQDGYFLPPEETEALWHAHIDNDVVWLHGMSGTGKSSLEEQFSAHIGQPFLRFNGREDVESAALFGQLTVESGENGGTVWKDGLLTEGVRKGARVLLDEATSIPAGIMLGVQWLLEKGGSLMLTDKPAEAGDRLVKPDHRFRLTFADNTRGQGDTMGSFNGTGVMNTATLNRVGLTLEIKYLTTEQELTVLRDRFGDIIGGEVLEDMVLLAANLRKALREDQLSLAFSLRNINNVLTKAYNYRTMNSGEALRRGFMEGYANLLPTDEEQGAAINFFQMQFGSY